MMARVEFERDPRADSVSLTRFVQRLGVLVVLISGAYALYCLHVWHVEHSVLLAHLTTRPLAEHYVEGTTELPRKVQGGAQGGDASMVELERLRKELAAKVLLYISHCV